MLLTGKCAIVTGSTSGIGLGIACALAEAGADIVPGWVLTPLVQRQIEERAGHERISIDAAKANLLSEKQPSHEFATPEQIGAVAVFLCSEAAAQIRGTALPVDGGWTAH
jgi:3-hydroxybutyrate dehydrogenase